MTRSKIQRMKFFIFLLIFLLGQIAACSGSFRERSTNRELSVSKSVSDGDVSHSLKEKNEQHKAGSSSSSSSSPSSVSTKKVADEAEKQIGANEKSAADITSKASVEVSTGTVQTTTLKSKEHATDDRLTSLNSGALLRGFLVFVGLGILVTAYIVFRTFRLNKTRTQMIRKYGVLAHRQDVEMRPLPLEEEDDEDTIVFDVSNVLTNNTQHHTL